MGKQEVLGLIDAAYRDAPLPAGEDLRIAAMRERSGGGPKVREGLHWHEVRREEVTGHPELLYHLQDAGVRYYLPAYMRLMIEDPEVACSTAGEVALIALADIDPAALSGSQRDATQAFLDYMRDQANEAGVPLERALLRQALDNVAS